MANPSPQSVWAQVQDAQNAPPPTMAGAMPSTPPVFAPMSGPQVTQAPTPLDQNIGNDQQQLQKVRWEQTNPWGTPENHPGKLGKTAHVFATLGNIAGDIFAPDVMAHIPGSQLNLETNERHLTSRLNQEQQEQSMNESRAATTAHEQEETKEAPAKAASEEGLQGAETAEKNATTAQGPSLAAAYAHAVNESLKRNEDPSQNPIVQHLGDAITGLQKPAAAKGMDHVSLMGQNGKPYAANYDPNTGKYTDAAGKPITNPIPYEKPNVTNINQNANHEFAEEERGRGLLDKAEASYRTAQQGAETMRNMIASANSGNKVSAQVLPLEGALEITTAQGVHRINRTEVDQYAGGGSLYDKVAGEVGKVTAGQPIPKNILNDMRKLTDIQEKAAYNTYKGAYDSATKRYGLKNEEALKEPGNTGNAPPGATAEVFDAKGTLIGHAVNGKYVPLGK